MPRLSRLAVFAVGLALGLALWLVPVFLFGVSEPWAGQTPAYVLALLGTGLVVGFLGPTQLFTTVAGVFTGQLLVLLGRVLANPAGSELWMVSVVFLAGYTFVATGIGAALGGLLRRRLSPVSRGEDRRSRSP
jgi:hypothetical protein